MVFSHFKTVTDMKNIIQEAVAKAMSYAQYNLLFQQLVAENRTTGEETQEKIDYTKLNLSRTKRLDKTAEIEDAHAEVFGALENSQTWLVISEPWCGDAAQTLPYLNKIAELSDRIDLKIVLRDENPELMDLFLTNGSRSIPILIILDEEMEVLAKWGPRSAKATKMVADYKEEHGVLDAAFKEQLQVWYNNNKGEAIVSELAEMMNEFA